MKAYVRSMDLYKNKIKDLATIFMSKLVHHNTSSLVYFHYAYHRGLKRLISVQSKSHE